MSYRERYPVGTRVQIAPRGSLERFQREWTMHNSLMNEQLDFAAKEAVVTEVGFYHGGDPLYVLAGVPGVWHEGCLRDSQPGAV